MKKIVWKKSLSDSIKNKRAGDRSVTPRGQKTEPTLKIAANKIFHVSRNQQGIYYTLNSSKFELID